MRKALPIYFVQRQVWRETQCLHNISEHFQDKAPKNPYSRTYSRTEKNFRTDKKIIFIVVMNVFYYQCLLLSKTC